MGKIAFPGANQTAQWWGSALLGSRMSMVRPRLVLHTTEGVDWPGYRRGRDAPHFTLNGGALRQHHPINRNSRALVNAPGGVETNTLDAVQIELVGTCDPIHRGQRGWLFWPDATDAQLRPLAELVVWLHREWGLPITGRGLSWLPYPRSYGSRSGQRMSDSRWSTFTGICGHQHVPENDHGDPGNFPIGRLLAMAQTIANPTPTLPATSATTDWFDMATKKELEDVVRTVVRQELNKPFAGPWLATFGTRLVGGKVKPVMAMEKIAELIGGRR